MRCSRVQLLTVANAQLRPSPAQLQLIVFCATLPVSPARRQDRQGAVPATPMPIYQVLTRAPVYVRLGFTRILRCLLVLRVIRAA